jgi:DNA-directed RNA polymerase specialized sigma24 family protein
MGASPNGDLDPRIASMIRYKVRRLVGLHGFTKGDEKDLRQELAMHVVRGLKRHDPRRSSAVTYADRIVASKIATIIQSRAAQKRDRRVEKRIDDAPESALSDGAEAMDQFALVVDVQHAISRLSPELRPIAILFMKFAEAEVVRRTGMSRQKVRGLQMRIRQSFESMGLPLDSFV